MRNRSAIMDDHAHACAGGASTASQSCVTELIVPRLAETVIGVCGLVCNLMHCRIASHFDAAVV